MSRNALQKLYKRPGFMIRRAHQIASSVFFEETDQLQITPTQYGMLYLLRHVPRADQISIAQLLGFDRSTTSLVAQTLEKRGLIARRADPRDRRRNYLELTPAGEETLRRLATPVRHSLNRLLAVFDDAERASFLRLLQKLTDAFNHTTRVPIRRLAKRTAGANGRHRNTAAGRRPRRREIDRHLTN